MKRASKRILVPVDFSPATLDQVLSARDVAATIEVRVLLAHVVEPVHFAVSGLPDMPNVDVERRFRAEKSLAELTLRIPPKLRRRRQSPMEIRRRKSRRLRGIATPVSS